MTTTQAAKHTPVMRAAKELNLTFRITSGGRRPVTDEELATIIARETQAPTMAEALKAIVNWCNHPGHGGQYDLPKPLIPYLSNAERVLRDAGVIT